jgi:hypothetical protein
MAVVTLPSTAGEMEVPPSCGLLCKEILHSHLSPILTISVVLRFSSA